MLKFRPLLRKVANLLAFFTPILNLLYLAQPYTRVAIPLPLFLKLNAIFPLIMVVCYLVFIPTLLFSKLRVFYKIILALLMIPLLCLTGFVMLVTQDLSTSAQLGEKRYNLVVVDQIGDISRDCLLYQCNSHNLACKTIDSYLGDCRRLEQASLVVNSGTNEVNVFLQDEGGTRLDYTYGNQPRSYIDKLEFEGHDYYLAYYHDYALDNSTYSYMLYRCPKGDLTCERLPFQYETRGLPYSYLEFDNSSHNINIWIDNELIYEYGLSPRCYVQGCLIIYK